MSVLQRSELESSPLADLHAIASELGLEGFRSKRKAELVDAILRAGGGSAAEDADDGEPDEVPAEEALEPSRYPAAESGAALEPPSAAEDDRLEDDERGVDEDPRAAPAPEEHEVVSGVLDVLPNGSGFVRVDPGSHSREDVYVSQAQIRRCELRAGDELSGPVRRPRRGERHPSLIRVETVNGAEAEPPAQRPEFRDLRAVFPSERLAAPAALEGVAYGKGSRVAISGPPGAGATTLLREVMTTLAERHPELRLGVALVGVRPEEVAEWGSLARAEVVGGAFDAPPDAQAQAAELLVERAKRRAERGEHAAVAVDSLEALPHAARRRVLGAARATEEAGTVTVLAVAGEGPEALRWATTRIVLEPAGPESSSPRVAADRSGTLRSDRF